MRASIQSQAILAGADDGADVAVRSGFVLENLGFGFLLFLLFPFKPD